MQAGTDGIHVNAQHFWQQSLFVLAVAERVSAAAAIAQAEVEHAIRSEGELAGFVVVEVSGLVDGKQNPLRKLRI